jgi:pimeloyl-ACP methyl ester carboxylesterase
VLSLEQIAAAALEGAVSPSIASQAASIRTLFGGEKREGYAATHPIGPVHVPSLFVCGDKDTALLCTRPYARRSADFCPGGYSYLAVDCGHDLLACANATSTRLVTDAIVRHLANRSHAARMGRAER